MSLGLCPYCGAPGKTRERRPAGNDTCGNGHKYPTMFAVEAAPEATQDVLGPLVIVVPSHEVAEEIAMLFGPVSNATQQGVRIIPYASSALGYCSGETRLFRGLVVAPLRSQMIARESYDAWIEKSIVPYLAPGAQRIVL